MNPIDWPRFVEIIHAHQRFLLTSHIRPDCDALGSELGMLLILESLGKQVTIVDGQVTPPNLQFIDPEKRLKAVEVDAPHDAIARAEAIMVLDTSAWAQLGPMAEVVRASNAKKIVLDHHVSEDDLGAESFKNTEAEATGRLVVEAADALGVALTPAIARPLFAALATDTGWFRFGSTTSQTLTYASRLVAAGTIPAQVYNDLYEQETLPRLQLRGRILGRTKAELGGRLVHTSALREDFAQTGALASDTEDIINLTLAVAGTEVAVIFVEQATGGCKLSFRSCTPKVDCSKLAEHFGGGGHKAAAGAFVQGTYAESHGKVLDLVRTAMQ